MKNPPPDTTATPRPHAPPTTSKEAASGKGLRPRPWWLIFLVLLAGNYLVAQLFFPEPSSITVPYTFFKQQVEAGNVADVTSVGDSIQGNFKKKTAYPPAAAGAPAAGAAKARESLEFRTQRPAFADQDLEKRLDEKGVVIKAVDENASSWFKLLVGFGPTLLLIAAFVWISRRAAAAAGGGGLFSLGRSRAKRYS
jgi:cell division protease FtsH